MNSVVGPLVAELASGEVVDVLNIDYTSKPYKAEVLVKGKATWVEMAKLKIRSKGML